MDRPPLTLVPADTLRAHEEIDPDAVARLVREMIREKAVLRPIVADRGTHVVLDGHHRLAALRSIGCRRVPVYLVEYASDSIKLSTWRPMDPPPTKLDVIEHGLKGNLFPRKTTKHEFPWTFDERIALSDLTS